MIAERLPLPNEFQFTLIATLPEHGSVKLVYAPDGWQGYASRWVRHAVYHGVYRTIETQLRFIREGADFLRAEYNRHGTNATTKIRIEKLNYDTLEYETNFFGEFNFAQMTDIRGVLAVDVFDVAVTDTGIATLLRAREKIVCEIPLHEDANAPRVDIVEAANAFMTATLFSGCA